MARNTLPDYIAPRWVESLDDRRQVLIRPYEGADAPALRSFLHAISAESTSHAPLHPLDQALAAAAPTAPAPAVTLLLALVREDGRQTVIGAAGYAPSPGAGAGMATVAVLAEWRCHGVATALVAHLAEIARGAGLRELEARASLDAGPARDLARRLGIRFHPDECCPDTMLYRGTL